MFQPPFPQPRYHGPLLLDSQPVYRAHFHPTHLPLLPCTPLFQESSCLHGPPAHCCHCHHWTCDSHNFLLRSTYSAALPWTTPESRLAWFECGPVDCLVLHRELPPQALWALCGGWRRFSAWCLCTLFLCGGSTSDYTRELGVGVHRHELFGRSAQGDCAAHYLDLVTHVAGVQVRSWWRPAQQVRFGWLLALRFCNAGRRSFGWSVAGGALACRQQRLKGGLTPRLTHTLHASQLLGQVYFRVRILSTVQNFCFTFWYPIFVPGARGQGTVRFIFNMF